MQNAPRIISALSAILVVSLVLSCSDDSSNPSTPDISGANADSLQGVVDSLLELSGYVGSDACRQCHAKQYDEFVKSAHAFTMQAVVGQSPGFPHGKELEWPSSVANWGEIEYVVGGSRNYAMFIDTAGNVVTDSTSFFRIDDETLISESTLVMDTVLMNPNASGVENNCAKCHATGWSPDTTIRCTTADTSADTCMVLDTTYGHNWVWNGVQCEQCHGPGARHAADSGNAELGNILVNTRSEACLSCHFASKDRKAEPPYPAVHDSVHEVASQTSDPRAHDCVACHSPHSPDSTYGPVGW